MKSFLVIDDDEMQRTDICQFFSSIGNSVNEATTLQDASRMIEAHGFEVVVLNAGISAGKTRDFVRRILALKQDSVIMVYSDMASVQEAVLAVGEGAFGMLQKPFSIPELNFQVKRALEQQSEKAPPRVFAHETYKPYNFIGNSPEIIKIFNIVNRIAKTNARVIILGETGTGKELVASAIHYNSLRSESPFVPVNCAAIPEQLLESELFGFEKGAFTGADRPRVGRFEHANGGTVFLDEVADMSLVTQAKVLRVIQEKAYERLGSNESRKVDVRIVSATNKDLMHCMQSGSFREDLYYRLNVVTIRLPPLRERAGDIELLTDFFLKKATQETGKKVRCLEAKALKVLRDYHWPGNIRELENTIERAVLLAEGDVITAADLDLLYVGIQPAGGEDRLRLPPAGIRLEDAERQLIEQALERSNFVQRQAAKLLGISPRTLNYKIKTLGITHEGWRQNS